MRVLLWILKLFIFFVVLAFAVKNSDPVRLNFYFDMNWQAPLVIVLFVFFTVGVVFGLLSLLPALFRLRRENSRLKREVQNTISLNTDSFEPPRT